MTTASEIAEAFLNAVEAGDADGAADLWAAEASLSFPYAPDGFPRAVQGPEAARSYWRDAVRGIEHARFLDRRISAFDDGRGVLVESRGDLVVGGRPYRNVYAMTFRIEGSRIVEYREYYDPLVVQQTFQSSP